MGSENMEKFVRAVSELNSSSLLPSVIACAEISASNLEIASKIDSGSDHQNEANDIGAKELVISSGTDVISDVEETDVSSIASHTLTNSAIMQNTFKQSRAASCTSGSSTEGLGVVGAVRKLIAGQEQPQAVKPVQGGVITTAVPNSIMRVKYSKKHAKRRSKSLIYPYAQMKEKSTAHRGYPVDGPDALKRSKGWKIQIVGAPLGAPPEPLAQFPQQELLTINNGEYHGVQRMSLTAENVGWNSGVSFLPNPKIQPTSESFYTSGYVRESAVEVVKPFPHSIYYTVVSGVPVEVPSKFSATEIQQQQQ